MITIPDDETINGMLTINPPVDSSGNVPALHIALPANTSVNPIVWIEDSNGVHVFDIAYDSITSAPKLFIDAALFSGSVNANAVTTHTGLYVDGGASPSVAIESLLDLNGLRLRSGGIMGWTAAALDATAVYDTGISRSAANQISVGNGTTGDASGTVVAAIFSGAATKANALSTTGASVNVSAAAPGVVGNVLTLTDATHATWQAPASAGISALTGDVTASGSGSVTATIANSAVTLAKMADITTSSLIYRKTAGSGAPEVNTLATLKTDLGLTGTNSGDQTSVSGSSGSCTGNAATVSTNANLTGPITSIGNATSIASQTGTGTKFVVDTSPTIATPTVSGNLTFSTANAQLVQNVAIAIRDAASGNRGTLRVMPNGTVASVPAALQFFGTDYSADSTNYECLSIFSKGSSDATYIIKTDHGGTGTVRLLQLTTGANTGIIIDASGNVGVAMTPTKTLDVTGTFRVSGIATMGAPVTLKGYTVATLPTGVQGHLAFCTDLLAPTFMAGAVGGGAIVGPVFFDGSAWKTV